jgi:type IV pilus assembly protein PilY1
VQYACQKNFILGIGDTNTHADTNLPGSLLASSHEPARPTLVTSDTTVDTRLATNKVGALEGLGNLGEAFLGWSTGNQPGYLMAGLAYDSHTKDMRPNDFGAAKGSFKTTVETFWLDVMESGQAGNNGRNQFWLAAKYGGFTVPAGYDTYLQTAPLTQSQWNTTGRLDRSGRLSPENYYDAGTADKMVAGLKTAFGNIASKTGTASALGLVTLSTTTTGDASYSASFDASKWAGELKASTITFDASGNPGTPVVVWQASGLLDTLASGTGWNTARLIATSNATSAASGVAFRYASVTNSTFRSALGTGASDVFNYLRGDRTNEGASGTAAYRSRINLLGDITNSRAIAVGVPAETYTDVTNAGYASFKSARASRKTMVYAGANDGMLHAFNGSLTDANGGKEAFAYVPSLLFQGPDATPAVNGLLSLSNKDFVHHFFVDASPYVLDIDFDKAGNPVGTLPTAAPDWHSILVGGLGKGGKGYYALDVTDPALITTETILASKVLWEFTHEKLGFSYGQPTIVKTAKYGWVCILTSGYNNADGKGYFFILNPKTGTLLEPPISTGVGTVSNPSGMTHATAFVQSYGDYVADSIYAGDLLGNVWRLDLTPTTGNYASPTAIASLKAADGTSQPVTTRPMIEVEGSTFKRFVFIGTGKLLADTDITTNQQQTFYAINDGTQTNFNVAGTLPSGVTFPVMRNNLNPVTSSDIDGIGSNPAFPSGWYQDLAVVNNVAERINAPITTNNGIVAYSANYPGGDVCTPSGSNKTYARAYATGQSKLQNSSGATTAYLSGLNLITDLTFISNRGRVRLITGTDQSNIAQATGLFSGTDKALQMNWREIPALD